MKIIILSLFFINLQTVTPFASQLRPVSCDCDICPCPTQPSNEAYSSRKGSVPSKSFASGSYSSSFSSSLGAIPTASALRLNNGRPTPSETNLADKWKNIMRHADYDAPNKDLERRLLGLEINLPAIDATDPVTNDLNAERRKTKRFAIWSIGGSFVALVVGGISFYLMQGTGGSSVHLMEAYIPNMYGKYRWFLRGGSMGFAVGQLSDSYSRLLKYVTKQDSYAAAMEFITTKALPVAWETLQKMLLMEGWRRVWTIVFKKMKQGYYLVFRSPYCASLWEKYAPEFIRSGVKKLFVKSVERNVSKIIDDWISYGRNLVVALYSSAVRSSPVVTESLSISFETAVPSTAI